jgi:hypothetical protein
MQARISQGPYAALGITDVAAASDVRTAFLELTKRFHPARFGRMANDIQRQSNEVFLGLKAAHDALMKALGGGKRDAMQSGGMPVIQHEGSGRTVMPGRPTTTGAMPAVAKPTSTGAIPTLAKPTNTGTIPTLKPSTTGAMPAVAKPNNTGAIPVQRPPQPTPSIARGTDRSGGSERPSAPAVARTATPIQPARTTTPPLGTPVQRSSTQPMRPVTPTGSRPGGPPARPPGPSQAINPDTVRGVVPPREPAFDERSALREALMQLNDESWGAARATLQNLSAKVPQSKNYRALFTYARGREAQAAGKLDEAAREYQAALQIDPDLSVAKQALADVQRRR